MGTKGNRKGLKKSDTYKEPDLLVSVNDILEKAQESGLYINNALKIVDLISTFNDVEIKYEAMDASKSGSLSYIDGKWIMCINSNHNIKRQRFTMAHELGHYMLHKGKNTAFADTTFFRSDDMSSIEYQANEFAARLLMPENALRKLIDEDKVKNIGELASNFEVSSSAMKYRVISLGYKIKDNG
jgi:Zn-dependent peptidase ImmA (M78 family)